MQTLEEYNQHPIQQEQQEEREQLQEMQQEFQQYEQRRRQQQDQEQSTTTTTTTTITEDDSSMKIDQQSAISDTELIRIDPTGDAKLMVESQTTHKKRNFQISSKILSFASPVFAKLFGPNFSEGRQIIESNS